MRLSLCIVSATPELFQCAVDHATRHAVGAFDIFGFGNGGGSIWNDAIRQPGNDPYRFPLVMRYSEENMGVPYALHEIWKMASGRENHPLTPVVGAMDPHHHVLAYIHDDVDITEDGWDQRVLRAFSDHPNVGLAGFGGSTGLGGSEIYKVPYEIHQLGRRDFWSNMVGAEIHGKRTTQEMPIVSTDGFSMILRRSLLDKIEGWSWWPFELVHHAYDYGIACMNRRHGYKARLVPCSVNHKGGMTATRAVHQDMAKKYGGDNQVHADSHRFVYEAFRDVYPLRLK